MESTRSIGYSLNSAIADIVDNSIAAEAENVWIQFPDKEFKYLTITDDGTGMTESSLLQAMRYGSLPVGLSRKNSDLGRFGLGLKMASLSQCRCLTLITKPADGKVSIARWDLDEIGKDPAAWKILLLDPADLSEDFLNSETWERFQSLSCGTVVIWSKFDLMMRNCPDQWDSDELNRMLVEAIDHLRLVFHRYLEGDEKHDPLVIACNGRKLTPRDPFLKTKSSRPQGEDCFQLAGSTIRMQPWLLPFPKNLSRNELQELGDLQQNQGFYIYRNRRLVIWGTWFRIIRKSELSRLLRIQVDIPNSPEIDRLWALDVKKSTVRIPEVLRDKLANQVSRLGVIGTRTWRRPYEEKLHDSLWQRTTDKDRNVTYTLNFEHPLIKSMLWQQKGLKTLLHLIEKTLPVSYIYSDMADDRSVSCGSDSGDLTRLEGFSDEQKQEIVKILQTIKANK